MTSPDAFLSTTRAAVIRRWNLGYDTLTVGRHYGIDEADVCRILAAKQDRKHFVKLALARRAPAARSPSAQFPG
jgi:hypothetical protein